MSAMTRRTKAEMEEMDAKIRPLYERGIGCRIIGQVLETNPATIFKRVKRMGINRSSEDAQEVIHNQGLPFVREPADENLRRSAIGRAIQWFMERGYAVSIPVEPVKYDLVAESDQGLQRVQIKTTTQKSREGRWVCSLTSWAYDKNATLTAAGKRRQSTYRSSDVDFFFIETAARDLFLLPIALVEGMTCVTLDRKYKNFKVT